MNSHCFQISKIPSVSLCLLVCCRIIKLERQKKKREDKITLQAASYFSSKWTQIKDYCHFQMSQSRQLFLVTVISQISPKLAGSFRRLVILLLMHVGETTVVDSSDLVPAGINGVNCKRHNSACLSHRLNINFQIFKLQTLVGNKGRNFLHFPRENTILS